MRHSTSRSLLLAAAVSAAFVLSACHGDSGTSASASTGAPTTIPVPTVTSPAASPFLTPVPSPTKAANVKPPHTTKPAKTKGKKSPSCVDGWTSPPPSDSSYAQALNILRQATGWKGTFVVTDIRAFSGPESPPDPETGYLRVVQRWYVKGYVKQDPSLQGRFLIESREFGSGLSAVAAYATTGWSSPDWVGFQYEGTQAAKAYSNLPGTWAGTPYDFVKGGEGLDIPGLPSQVVGCLAGT